MQAPGTTCALAILLNGLACVVDHAHWGLMAPPCAASHVILLTAVHACAGAARDPRRRQRATAAGVAAAGGAGAVAGNAAAHRAPAAATADGAAGDRLKAPPSKPQVAQEAAGLQGQARSAHLCRPLIPHARLFCLCLVRLELSLPAASQTPDSACGTESMSFPTSRSKAVSKLL